MTKKILALAMALILTFGLCGCQLAKPEGDKNLQKDRLMGVYITRNYIDLFDMDSYLQENLDKIIAQNGKLELPAMENEGKLYAELTVDTYPYSEGEGYTYAFPELDGIMLAHFRMSSGEDAYTATAVGEGICDIHSRVGGEDAGISGTIWMAKDSGEAIFYLNPVYQTADGQVYLVPGSGIHFSSGVGGRATQTMEERYTVTVNGETVEEHFAVEVSIDMAEPTQTVTVIQMNGKDLEVCRTTYQADALPDELTPEDGTAYLIVQSNTKTGTQRQICQPSDNHTEVFILLDQQICIRKYIYVNWE